MRRWAVFGSIGIVADGLVSNNPIEPKTAERLMTSVLSARACGGRGRGPAVSVG